MDPFERFGEVADMIRSVSPNDHLVLEKVRVHIKPVVSNWRP